MKVQQANTKGIHYSRLHIHTRQTNTIQLLYDLILDLMTIELFYFANFQSYEDVTSVSN